MSNLRLALQTRQRGFTLIVVLVFLGILTLLGLTVARTASLEERMAGNTRDRDLAFQAAEAALQDAATDLQGYIAAATPFDGSTAGLVTFVANNAGDAAYWNAYDWTDASQTASVSLTQGMPSGHEPPVPQYVIEKKPDTGPAPPAPGATLHFRVTARGMGANPSTVVILQAEYEYEYK